MLRATRQHTEVLTKSDGEIRPYGDLLSVPLTAETTADVSVQAAGTKVDKKTITETVSDAIAFSQVAAGVVEYFTSDTLAFTQIASGVVEHHSGVFQRVISLIGLGDEEGEVALAMALLEYADATYTGEQQLDNPAIEALRLFEEAHINPNALNQLRRLFNEAVERYARTVR